MSAVTIVFDTATSQFPSAVGSGLLSELLAHRGERSTRGRQISLDVGGERGFCTCSFASLNNCKAVLTWVTNFFTKTTADVTE